MLLPDNSILLNLLLQATVFSAVALLVLRAKSRSAVWRHAIAYWALVGLGTLVALSLLLQAQGRAMLTVPLDLAGLAEEPLQLLTPLWSSGTAPAFEFTVPTALPLDLPLVANVASTQDAAIGTGIASPALWLGTGFALLWLIGTGIALLRLLLAAIRLRMLQQRGIALTCAQQSRINRVLQNLAQNPAQVHIAISAAVTSPVQTGFAQAQLLLPLHFMEHCDAAQLEAVLSHELAHWQRRDNLANLLQKIILSLYWFHPLVHRLDRIVARSREEICDNFVLARHSAVDYGETLLMVNAWQARATADAKRTDCVLAVGIMGKDWNLETRISKLIDQKREKTMQLSSKSATLVRVTSIGASLLLASCILAPTIGSVHALEPQVSQTDQADAQAASPEEPRQPPPARDTETLSEEVFNAISSIQTYLSPREPENTTLSLEERLETAKQLLDTLYEEKFATANGIEQATILNFYTNYYLFLKDYPEALRVFEQLLTIETLRGDIRLRALRSLGQLYAVQEQWQQSIDAYTQWLALTNEEDRVVMQGLGHAHYELEQWQQALDYWVRYMAVKPDADLVRDDYAFRNGLYFTLGDYESALALTKDMILRFNDQRDWDNLQAIYHQINQSVSVAELNAEPGGAINFNVAEPEIAFATVIPTDGDYLPLLAIAPMYPRAAAEDGMEGWVLLSFTVNELGNVVEDSIVVEDAEPPEVFNNNSIRAASQFLFQPRMVAGEAQAVPGVQYLFRYRLRDDDV